MRQVLLIGCCASHGLESNEYVGSALQEHSVYRDGHFPAATSGKELPVIAGDAGDTGLMAGLGRSPGEGNGNHSSILAWEIPQTEEPGGL